MINNEYEVVVTREATPKDYKAWDDFVKNHPDATPYHLIAWKQAIQHAYHHECFYLIAEQDSKIIGILPLVKISPPLLTGSICSLPFCDVGGMLVSDAKAEHFLLTKAKVIARMHTSHNLHLRQSAQESDAEIKSEAESAEQKVRMILPLPDSSDALSASFKSKLRSQIKKAAKNNITYSQTNDPAAIASFYGVMQANMHLLGSPVHSKKWFESIINFYGDKAQIGIVKKDNTVVGAAILLLCGNMAVVPWASTLTEYNKYSPNMSLYWGLLGFAADNGFTKFDFGRSTVGEGTFRFKKQWGATPVALDWRDYNQHGLIESSPESSSKIRPLVANTWAKLPFSVVNLLGPQLRRYISL